MSTQEQTDAEILKICDVAELQFAQGDLARAIAVFVDNALPLGADGARECERLMREAGEGNTQFWGHSSYLQTVTHIAEEVLVYIREAGWS